MAQLERCSVVACALSTQHSAHSTQIALAPIAHYTPASHGADHVMKSERRHELKTNALARGLGSPETLRRHGSKVLLAVIVILLIIVWVRQRRSSTAERTIQIAAALTEAR